MKCIKKLSVFILSLSLFYSLYGQSSSSVWEIMERNYTPGAPIDFFAYVTGKDTVMNGSVFNELWKFQYKKDHPDYYGSPPFEISDTTFMGYIHRDSLNIRVLLKEYPIDAEPRNQCTDGRPVFCLDTIFTLYNFDKGKGDTIEHYFNCSKCNPEISFVDTVMPKSNQFWPNRKLLILNSNVSIENFSYIQGIGSDLGLFNLCCPKECIEPTDPCGYELYRYCEDINKDCMLSGIFTGMKSKFDYSDLIEIYPVPARTTIRMQLNEATNDYSFQIWDITGNVVISETIISEKSIEIDISEFTEGIYLVEVYKNNQTVKRKKILVY